MLLHVSDSRGARREPVFFLLLTVAFLAAAGAAVGWRALSPTDGTTVNVGDVAVSGGAVVIVEATPGNPLHAGDRVVAIDGIALPRPGGTPVHDGEIVRYQVIRDGQRLEIAVPLQEYAVPRNLVRSWPSALVNLVLLVTSASIFLARPREPAAHAAITASGIGVAAVAASGYFQLEALDLALGGQFWRWFGGELCFALLWGAMLHFALAFPEVADPRRFRRQVLAGYAGTLGLPVLVGVFAVLAPDDPAFRFSLLASPALGPLYVYPPLIVAMLIVKYVRDRDPVIRRRLRWVVTSLGGGAALYLAVWTVPAAIRGTPLLPWPYQTLAFLTVPFAVALAILRHRALNIDVVLSRSMVYGTLTVLLAGLYLGVVGLLSLLAPPLDRPWQQAIAAVAIALAVQPLRSRLQTAINTRLFGERTDPYRVVSRLATRLEGIHAPAEQLPAVVETIGTALRLPYVAIELDRDSGTEQAASFGRPVPQCHRLPLTYQGEEIGRLVIARRGPREVFGGRERTVLAEVARHAGTVVHAARLTSDLVRSRDRLVVAREEERRRLLRELHDGVGPTLAAIKLGLQACRRTMDDASPASALIGRLQEALGDAIGEIRKLARDLRPPLLEERGLLAAVEEYVETVNHAAGTGPRIELDFPEELPWLPPAVDVAAFRIIGEALTNVTRHAEARHCTVRLRAAGALDITVTDDGVGLAARNGSGFGLTSMRERAAELGGRFRAERTEFGGTRVHAVLPLPQEENR
jgi:two-component system NarL family sensor kinase